MEPLKQKFKNSSFSNSLVRIGDLVNFEGPLLTLFEDVKNGHLYLFDWVDRFDAVNRWLIYQVYPKLLLAFIQKKITYIDLFNKPVSGIYYFTDIRTNTDSLGNYEIVPFDSIPKKYLPEENDVFDKADCPNYEKIIFFLINRKKENLYNLKTSPIPSYNYIRNINLYRLKRGASPGFFFQDILTEQNSKAPVLHRQNRYKPTYSLKKLSSVKNSGYKSKKHA